MKKCEGSEGLGELIERGGIYYTLQGRSVSEILEALVALVPLPQVIRVQDLFRAVMERENLMSTSIGRGIAVPHPRNPLVSEAEEQFVALAFPENPIDWNAMDGKPVDTVLLIVSSSAQSHLRTLSSITFFCQKDAFLKLLKERAPRETLVDFIKKTEHEWRG